jgi:hypothetical protein
MKHGLSFVLAIILLVSCSKENISPTQGQVTAAKLKTALAPYQITNVNVYYNNIAVVTNETGYAITDDGFIKVSGSNFNLGQLRFYQLAPPILTLYF